MNSVPHSESSGEKSICQKHVDSLLDSNSAVDGALVSSIDGFEVAARVAASISPPKLAAMTSSLLALAAAITQESKIGPCRDIVVEAGQGRVLLMDIPSAKRNLLLTVLCGDATTLGSVLWAARNTRESIAAELDGRAASS